MVEPELPTPCVFRHPTPTTATDERRPVMIHFLNTDFIGCPRVLDPLSR